MHFKFCFQLIQVKNWIYVGKNFLTVLYTCEDSMKITPEGWQRATD